jgi:hypothetical protein
VDIFHGIPVFPGIPMEIGF